MFRAFPEGNFFFKSARPVNHRVCAGAMAKSSIVMPPVVPNKPAVCRYHRRKEHLRICRPETGIFMRLPENTVRNVANRTRRYAATTPRLAFSNRRFVSVPLQGNSCTLTGKQLYPCRETVVPLRGNTDKSAIGDSESLISTDKAGTGIFPSPYCSGRTVFRRPNTPLPHCNTFFTTV